MILGANAHKLKMDGPMLVFTSTKRETQKASMPKEVRPGSSTPMTTSSTHSQFKKITTLIFTVPNLIKENSTMTILTHCLRLILHHSVGSISMTQMALFAISKLTLLRTVPFSVSKSMTLGPLAHTLQMAGLTVPLLKTQTQPF